MTKSHKELDKVYESAFFDDLEEMGFNYFGQCASMDEKRKSVCHQKGLGRAWKEWQQMSKEEKTRRLNRANMFVKYKSLKSKGLI